MEKTPDEIFQEFQSRKLNKSSALQILIAIIENSNSDSVRLNAFHILDKIGPSDSLTFKINENLLISDASCEIRISAAHFLTKKFQEKAISPLKWAFENEKDYNCIIEIINSLVNINSMASKAILVEEVRKIRRMKYLFNDSKITNKAFKKELRSLLKERNIEEFSNNELAEIIINYKTIIAMKEKFPNVYYELENARVKKLDLSDVEFEVRGWKSEFNNNINDLSEIPGLTNLKYLTHLYLSNNKITNIKQLIKLTNLSFLHISNNILSNIENIKYLLILAEQNLLYINLCGNRIANLIDTTQFNPEIEIILRNQVFY